MVGSWDDVLSLECLQEVLTWGLAMEAKWMVQTGLLSLENLESLPQRARRRGWENVPFLLEFAQCRCLWHAGGVNHHTAPGGNGLPGQNEKGM